MARGPEARLSSAIVQALRSRGAWAVKLHGNPGQRRGLPDVIACYKSVMLGLEVKLPGRERNVTPLQQATLDSIHRAEGWAHVVTSVAQVRRILNDIDRWLE